MDWWRKWKSLLGRRSSKAHVSSCWACLTHIGVVVQSPASGVRDSDDGFGSMIGDDSRRTSPAAESTQQHQPTAFSPQLSSPFSPQPPAPIPASSPLLESPVLRPGRAPFAAQTPTLGTGASRLPFPLRIAQICLLPRVVCTSAYLRLSLPSKISWHMEGLRVTACTRE